MVDRRVWDIRRFSSRCRRTRTAWRVRRDYDCKQVKTSTAYAGASAARRYCASSYNYRRPEQETPHGTIRNFIRHRLAIPDMLHTSRAALYAIPLILSQPSVRHTGIACLRRAICCRTHEYSTQVPWDTPVESNQSIEILLPLMSTAAIINERPSCFGNLTRVAVHAIEKYHVRRDTYCARRGR